MTTPGAAYLDDLRLALELNDMRVPDVVAPRDGHVLLGGMRFHYLDWGGEGRTPVVFLHGAGLTAHTWDLTCLSLRDGYRCYALDLRGHGDSEWSPSLDYGLEAHAGDAAAFVRELGLDAPVMVGMSLGGSTVARYAMDHPPRGLVVIDTGPRTQTAGGHRIAAFLRGPSVVESLEELVAKAIEFNPRRNAQLLRRSLLHSTVRLPDGAWAWKQDRRHPEHRLSAEAQRAAREAAWARVGEIRCPTLIVRGGESDVFTREGAAAFAAALPNARWTEVAGAGHTVQGDNPKGLVAELRPFLDALP